MAACPVCGKGVSVWSRDLMTGVCAECRAVEAKAERQKVKAEQEAAAEALRQAEAERERRIRDRVRKIKESLAARLRAGQRVFVYHSVYLPVDSLLLDEALNPRFDLAPLFQMGLVGWEAIQVIPRTVGVGLKNTSIGSTMGVTWGGGSGGNVAGVHVLLRKELSDSEINLDADDELAGVIRPHIRTAT